VELLNALVAFIPSGTWDIQVCAIGAIVTAVERLTSSPESATVLSEAMDGIIAELFPALQHPKPAVRAVATRLLFVLASAETMLAGSGGPDAMVQDRVPLVSRETVDLLLELVAGDIDSTVQDWVSKLRSIRG
jgi:hypothetical protein